MITLSPFYDSKEVAGHSGAVEIPISVGTEQYGQPATSALFQNDLPLFDSTRLSPSHIGPVASTSRTAAPRRHSSGSAERPRHPPTRTRFHSYTPADPPSSSLPIANDILISPANMQAALSRRTKEGKYHCKECKQTFTSKQNLHSEYLSTSARSLLNTPLQTTTTSTRALSPSYVPARGATMQQQHRTLLSGMCGSGMMDLPLLAVDSVALDPPVKSISMYIYSYSFYVSAIVFTSLIMRRKPEGETHWQGL